MSTHETSDVPSQTHPATQNKNSSPARLRFISRTDAHEVLVYISGDCVDGSTNAARAGYGIYWNPQDPQENRSAALQTTDIQTATRAALRATVVALKLDFLVEEKFKRVVIATDCHWVAVGATKRLDGWRRDGWSIKVQDKDLWESLAVELQRLEERGVSVAFWLIQEGDNLAAELASNGARILW